MPDYFSFYRTDEFDNLPNVYIPTRHKIYANNSILIHEISHLIECQDVESCVNNDFGLSKIKLLSFGNKLKQLVRECRAIAIESIVSNKDEDCSISLASMLHESNPKKVVMPYSEMISLFNRTFENAIKFYTKDRILADLNIRVKYISNWISSIS